MSRSIGRGPQCCSRARSRPNARSQAWVWVSSAWGASVVETAMMALMNGGWSVTPHGGVRESDDRARSRTSGPSHNIATAASKVARTSPTLPPSAMNASAKASAPAALLPRALDDDADVVEGRGDRGVRFMHGDADAAHLGVALQHRLGDGAGGRFHQPRAARAESVT